MIMIVVLFKVENEVKEKLIKEEKLTKKIIKRLKEEKLIEDIENKICS